MILYGMDVIRNCFRGCDCMRDDGAFGLALTEEIGFGSTSLQNK